MSSLPEFLLECIAEDEAVAEHGDGGLMEDAHFSTARVLAECEAKWQIMDEHYSWEAKDDWCARCSRLDWTAAVQFPCPTLRFLAAVYADRPGYREEWRP